MLVLGGSVRHCSRLYHAAPRRAFSASSMLAAAEIKRLGVVGAGQMVRLQPQETQ